MVTLHFLPYTEIEQLSSVGRIRKVLSLAKENKIVLLQGRLKKEEEAELIKTTMEEINKEFRGIELAVINPATTATDGLQKFKYDMMNMFFGDTQGLTIVGPSNIVKSIRRDPTKIELLTQEARSGSSRTAAKKKRR